MGLKLTVFLLCFLFCSLALVNLIRAYNVYDFISDLGNAFSGNTNASRGDIFSNLLAWFFPAACECASSADCNPGCYCTSSCGTCHCPSSTSTIKTSTVASTIKTSTVASTIKTSTTPTTSSSSVCCCDSGSSCTKNCYIETGGSGLCHNLGGSVCSSSACSNPKQSCPYDCCQGESTYYDKLCLSTQQCQNHKCVSTSSTTPTTSSSNDCCCQSMYGASCMNANTCTSGGQGICQGGCPCPAQTTAGSTSTSKTSSTYSSDCNSNSGYKCMPNPCSSYNQPCGQTNVFTCSSGYCCMGTCSGLSTVFTTVKTTTGTTSTTSAGQCCCSSDPSCKSGNWEPKPFGWTCTNVCLNADGFTCSSSACSVSSTPSTSNSTPSSNCCTCYTMSGTGCMKKSTCTSSGQGSCGPDCTCPGSTTPTTTGGNNSEQCTATVVSESPSKVNMKSQHVSVHVKTNKDDARTVEVTYSCDWIDGSGYADITKEGDVFVTIEVNPNIYKGSSPCTPVAKCS